MNIVEQLEDTVKIDINKDKGKIGNLNINIFNEENSSIFIPSDKSFTIKLLRKKLLFPKENINYKCIIQFYDTLNNLVYELSMSELDFWIYTDSIYNYIDQDLPDVSIFIKNPNTEYRCSILKLDRVDSLYDDYSYIMSLPYSHIYSISVFNIDYSITTRIKLNLSDEDLNRFIELQYYTFMINIDINDLSNTEYIQKYLQDTYY